MRKEKDTMGYVEVPNDAYYGAQTQRAFENFPVSGIKIPLDLIRSIAIIKKAAAIANHALGKLDLKIKDAIVNASDEVIDGKLDENFIIDVFQTGSGTSTNMNVNEVIANRASEILGGVIGEKKPVHPNDHVNMGQSSNDVIPTAIHLSAKITIVNKLMPNDLIYNRIGLRYLFRNRIQAHFVLKAHYARADYFELGIGYVFNGKKQ